MKKTKLERSRNSRRNVSSRKAPHKPRARRKTTPMPRSRQPIASELLGVVLAGSGWDPTAVASAIAAIGSTNNTGSIAQNGAMSVAGGQLVLLWLDEHAQDKAPAQSIAQTPQAPVFERAISREEIIATD